jgi:uncharacterized membrane protein
MILPVTIVSFFLLFPALILYLCQKYPFLDKIGAVVLCYLAGALVGNIGILPPDFTKVQNPLMLINICLALPLMFFSLDIRRWTRLAGKSLLSFALQTLSIMLVAAAGYYIFRRYVGNETWKIAGMYVGVYTGGTVNLGAIATALQVDRTIYLATHTSDVVVSSIYLLFLLTVGQKVYLHVLRPLKTVESGDAEESFNFCSYTGIFQKRILWPLTAAFGLALLIFIIGGLSFLILGQDIALVVAILVITTLGILASFIPKIRNIKMTYQLGNYFILIFSLVVSSMANVNKLMSTTPVILVYVAFTVFSCLLLQMAFSSLFKIDADTVIITTTAGICSPPLVPMVASSLKNREIVITGVTTGIIGWVEGTYLGITVAYILNALPF